MRKNLIFFLPNFNHGGSGNSIYKLCKNLNKKNYSIFIICVGKCFYKNKLKKICSQIVELNIKRTLFSFFYLNNIIRRIQSQSKLETIFISNHHYANVISMLSIKKSLKVKTILIERTSLDQLKRAYGFKDFLRKKIILYLVKILYKKANLVLANSIRESKDLAKYCRTKVLHIYPPSVTHYNKSVRKFKKNFKEIIILNVGSLIKEKGIDTIIKAVAKIKFRKFKLIILGKGYDKKQDEKRNLEILIDNLGLKKKVFLLGHKKITKNYYKQADLYINASHCEGFSTSIVDAINYHVPAICSDCKGGTREILSNGRGGDLFPVDDFVALSKKIDKFIHSPKSLRKKLIIARKNILKFKEKISAKNYEKIFKKI